MFDIYKKVWYVLYMTTTNIKALWLEEDDVIYIDDNSYRVVEVEGNDMVNIHLIDEEGFKRILTIPGDRDIPVLCD